MGGRRQVWVWAALAAQAMAAGASPAHAQTPAGEAAQYRACLSQVSTNADAAYDQALEWRDRGGGAPALHCAALALVALGKHGEAAARLQALAETPGGRGMAPQLLGQAGNAWLLAGQPGNAYNAFSAALNAFARTPDKEASPEQVDLLLDRAQAQAALNRWAAAETDLSRALSLDPENGPAYVFRASARRMQDKLEAALEDLQLALALSPQDAAALLERGAIYRLMKKPDQARKDWLAAIAAGPESETANTARRNLEMLDMKPE